jgi:DDE superfamily endonuclease
VSVQFLRQQAIIDVCVSWREDLRFAAETHHCAIPILQFARLAVGNVALQGRSAAGWRALGSMSRRSSSPTLRPCDIVIMDNLGSHKAKAVRQLIRAAGAKLFFLPKCSPDLNPIEQVFAKLERLLRKAAASQSAKSSEHLRPPNAPTSSETQAMPNPKSIML